MLRGQDVSKRDLLEVDLANHEDVAALVSSLMSMQLQGLGLSRCRLTSRAMSDVALLLRNMPSLRRLNLAAWRCWRSD